MKQFSFVYLSLFDPVDMAIIMTLHAVTSKFTSIISTFVFIMNLHYKQVDACYTQGKRTVVFSMAQQQTQSQIPLSSRQVIVTVE